LNRGQLRINSSITSCEPCCGRAHLVKYFKVSGSNGYIKRIDDNFENVMLDLMKVSFLDMILPRKHTNSYNIRLHKIVESVDVKMDDIKTISIMVKYQ
jgi:hypothetical protein